MYIKFETTFCQYNGIVKYLMLIAVKQAAMTENNVLKLRPNI